MTTDVAEATLTPVEEIISPVPETVAEAPPAGDQPEVAAPEDTAEAETPFDPTTLPEWQEIVKTPDPEVAKEAAAPEMPGESVQQVQRRLEAQRADFQRQFMQSSEPQVRDYLQNQLGLSPQDTHNLWQGALGPLYRQLLSNNSAYNNAVFHEAVNSKLPPEAQKAFYSQVYPDQAEAVKGVYTAGVAEERKAWESKIGTKLFTLDQLTKATKAAHARGLGVAEAGGEVTGATSGQEPQGQPATGRRFATEAAVNRAYNSGQINDRQYAAEMKRLTGKLPGE